MNSVMIQFNEVHKTYPKQINRTPAHHALKGVSFSLNEGATLGLVGLNGAGKSTSIRLIMGYMRADKGNISVLGHKQGSTKVRSQIGYLPEISNFPPNLTSLELLSFAGRCCDMKKYEITSRGEQLLKRLGIWDARNRRLSTYSKGMQQRASFAAALIHDPKLIILDEPMSGLDPIGRAEIISLIHDLRSMGKSILFCSHLLDDVQRITDHVAVLHQGNMLYHGSIERLCNKERSWTIGFDHDEQRDVYDQKELAELMRHKSEEIISIQSNSESLQDAFVRLIKGSLS